MWACHSIFMQLFLVWFSIFLSGKDSRFTTVTFIVSALVRAMMVRVMVQIIPNKWSLPQKIYLSKILYQHIKMNLIYLKNNFSKNISGEKRFYE
jgi:membrane-bound metal-dependent hydrolase YbcI (DUF457 family)